MCCALQEMAATADTVKRVSSGKHKSLRHRLTGRPVDEPPKDKASSLFLAGAAAGGTSKLLTAPIDRVKIMYQVSETRPFSVSSGLRTAQKIVKEAGFTALWRGNTIAVCRDMPYAAIMFASFSFIQEAACGWSGRPPDVASRSFAGCAAGAIATCLTYPLDMLRARFGAEWSSNPRYASYSEGVRQIVRREGFLALFSGLRPTLLGIMPYSALSFAAFETLKAHLKHRHEMRGEPLGVRGELPVREKLFAGGAAGLFAQSSTYPLHVVRRRMQAGRVAYTSTWQGLRQIYATEGVAGGLFKGLTLTFIKGPMQSAIGFTVNDTCKRMLRDRAGPDHH